MTFGQILFSVGQTKTAQAPRAVAAMQKILQQQRAQAILKRIEALVTKRRAADSAAIEKMFDWRIPRPPMGPVEPASTLKQYGQAGPSLTTTPGPLADLLFSGGRKGGPLMGQKTWSHRSDIPRVWSDLGR